MTSAGTGTHGDAHLWRARLDEGLTADERREFKAWLEAKPAHKAALAEAEATWGALGRVDLTGLDAHESDEALPREYANDNWHFFGSGAVAAAIAACIALTLTVWLVWPSNVTEPQAPQREYFVTSDGMAKTIRLPDQSRIRLASNSRLDMAYLDDRRDIRLLEGSARFMVMPNSKRPFIVRTDIAQVRVTGTQFRTSLQDNGLEVRVTQGSVDILPPGAAITDLAGISLSASEAILTKDGVEAVRLTDTVKTQSITKPNEAPAPERLEYVSAPLSKVIADINRLGGGPVTLDPQVASLRLSGSFEANEVGAIMDAIDVALPVTIEERDGVRTIIPE
ncbi:MAG: FecR domain-containing protein [Pseudomonadota bacterium]